MTRHGIRRLTALLACTAAATSAALGTGGAAQAATSAKVVCLGDGSDNFNPSTPTNVSVGTYFGVSGQNGNDNITGGTGNDYLFGDSPDNASHSGNDTLVGGPGYDAANGGPGIDRCDAEVEINCEL
ncbi:hypothetical protein [Streptomyces sp. RTd22]|uniref:hypothetical protein n=1 Tax=Streptomyces sp. RTd22 TaxID=1841249 RepID=UPI0007C47404|nr:hypothetical protein [Streptomyces sp. RTd22]